MFKISKLWERMHVPEIPTARTSNYCGQTWRARVRSGYAAFGIFKSL